MTVQPDRRTFVQFQTASPWQAPADPSIAYLKAHGFCVPPSWTITREAVLKPEQWQDVLLTISRDKADGHFWVLQSGRMNEGSQRQSLTSFSSEAALFEQLQAHFKASDDAVTVQLLPPRLAAGVLFVRHPLRQDLNHLVVEAVVGDNAQTQRLIFQPDGRLVFQSGSDDLLTGTLFSQQLLTLANQLNATFDDPQAAEWMFDGEQLWVLQSLTVGSLPMPHEAWTHTVADGISYQAITPLWYTLESRWLKNFFWQPLLKRQTTTTPRGSLENSEPYRRMQSHLYRNSAFFERLPDYQEALPPAWRGALVRQFVRPSVWTQGKWWLELQQLERHVNKLLRLPQQEGWPMLMELNWAGSRLARLTGGLQYRLPVRDMDASVAQVPPAVLDWLCDGGVDGLRAGIDPVFSFMSEQPVERNSLPASPLLQRPVIKGLTSRLRRRVSHLRYNIADNARRQLLRLGSALAGRGLLVQQEDVFFCYFDELWELHNKQRLPASLGGDTIQQRKRHYLADAHAGAPDWRIDQLGFGFNADHQAHDVLLGLAAVGGTAKGRVRRVLSGWQLNQIEPGDILIMQQCDPCWLPWVSQAAGIVLATHHAVDTAIWLARQCGIPCIHALDDAMHCLVDGQQVLLEAEAGRVTPV